MLPMMMRPPTSLRRRRLLGRSQEAVCEGGGEHLADLLRASIVDANDRPAIAARGSPAFSSLYSHEASERLRPLHLNHGTAKYCLAHRPQALTPYFSGFLWCRRIGHDADRSPLPERRGNNARQPTNDREQA
jgi:hypothetical protein